MVGAQGVDRDQHDRRAGRQALARGRLAAGGERDGGGDERRERASASHGCPAGKSLEQGARPLDVLRVAVARRALGETGERAAGDVGAAQLGGARAQIPERVPEAGIALDGALPGVERAVAVAELEERDAEVVPGEREVRVERERTAGGVARVAPAPGAQREERTMLEGARILRIERDRARQQRFGLGPAAGVGTGEGERVEQARRRALGERL